MASLSTDSQGRRRLQFVFAGKRQSLRLGRVSQEAADVIKAHVEHLQYCLERNKPWCPATSQWVDDLRTDQASDGMLMRLVVVGLLPASYAPVQTQVVDDTLGALLERYVSKRGDVKPATKINWRHTRRNLVEYFGQDKPLRAITEGDAEDWRRWLITSEKLADNTVNKRCQNAKQFFAYAARHRLVERNVFAVLKGSVRGNPKRMYFVTLEQSQKILDQCPDNQWRLIFALCRFGGLRCPSEVLLLQWDDVDRENERITVRSPKTEHHAGGEHRTVPLFVELRPYLQAVYDEAPEGSQFVITRYRRSTVNLRTQLTKIIKRAGLTPWPKLFQNLRSSRQTELANTYPTHVVCKWIGNSAPIAQEHYLQVTDAHFAQAVQRPTWGGAKSGAVTFSMVQCDSVQETETPHNSREIWGVTDVYYDTSGRYWTRSEFRNSLI